MLGDVITLLTLVTSIFVEMGKPVLMLEEQYRMHPEIAAFPSRHVYSERLKTHRLDDIN